MISAIISRLIILVFGTLYPAYASYKAVRTKCVKEYVKWMMYWIVFAFFTCFETFTDIFIAWFPFYYEVKVIIVLWLLSPATKGSSTLYRKFVHPMLTRREQEIDEYLNQAKEKGYSAVLQLGSKGVNYATNVIMQTALKCTTTDPLRMITSSYSDNNLSSQGRDRCDFVPRSQSLNAVPNFTDEFSEEDVPTVVEKGAARSREAPKRKTTTKATNTTSKSKATTSKSTAIKGRRRIKEENDVIDLDMYT
ncbi:REEP2 family protein [Megaselia abdita]